MLEVTQPGADALTLPLTPPAPSCAPCGGDTFRTVKFSAHASRALTPPPKPEGLKPGADDEFHAEAEGRIAPDITDKNIPKLKIKRPPRKRVLGNRMRSVFGRKHILTPQEFAQPYEFRQPVSEKPKAHGELGEEKESKGPEGKPLNPDDKPLGPDGRPLGPEGKPVGSDGRPLSPDGKPLGPDGKPLGPDGKPPGPDGKPPGPHSKTEGLVANKGAGAGADAAAERKQPLSDAELGRLDDETKAALAAERTWFATQNKRFLQPTRYVASTPLSEVLRKLRKKAGIDKKSKKVKKNIEDPYKEAHGRVMGSAAWRGPVPSGWGCGCPGLPCICYQHATLPAKAIPMAHGKGGGRQAAQLLWVQLEARLQAEYELHRQLRDLPPPPPAYLEELKAPLFCLGLDRCFAQRVMRRPMMAAAERALCHSSCKRACTIDYHSTVDAYRQEAVNKARQQLEELEKKVQQSNPCQQKKAGLVLARPHCQPKVLLATWCRVSRMWPFGHKQRVLSSRSTRTARAGADLGTCDQHCCLTSFCKQEEVGAGAAPVRGRSNPPKWSPASTSEPPPPPCSSATLSIADLFYDQMLPQISRRRRPPVTCVAMLLAPQPQWIAPALPVPATPTAPAGPAAGPAAPYALADPDPTTTVALAVDTDADAAPEQDFELETSPTQQSFVTRTYWFFRDRRTVASQTDGNARTGCEAVLFESATLTLCGERVRIAPFDPPPFEPDIPPQWLPKNLLHRLLDTAAHARSGLQRRVLRLTTIETVKERTQCTQYCKRDAQDVCDCVSSTAVMVLRVGQSAAGLRLDPAPSLPACDCVALGDGDGTYLGPACSRYGTWLLDYGQTPPPADAAADRRRAVAVGTGKKAHSHSDTKKPCMKKRCKRKCKRCIICIRKYLTEDWELPESVACYIKSQDPVGRKCWQCTVTGKSCDCGIGPTGQEVKGGTCADGDAHAMDPLLIELINNEKNIREIPEVKIYKSEEQHEHLQLKPINVNKETLDKHMDEMFVQALKPKAAPKQVVWARWRGRKGVGVVGVAGANGSVGVPRDAADQIPATGTTQPCDSSCLTCAIKLLDKIALEKAEADANCYIGNEKKSKRGTHAPPCTCKSCPTQTPEVEPDLSEECAWVTMGKGKVCLPCRVKKPCDCSTSPSDGEVKGGYCLKAHKRSIRKNRCRKILIIKKKRIKALFSKNLRFGMRPAKLCTNFLRTVYNDILYMMTEDSERSVRRPCRWRDPQRSPLCAKCVYCRTACDCRRTAAGAVIGDSCREEMEDELSEEGDVDDWVMPYQPCAWKDSRAYKDGMYRACLICRKEKFQNEILKCDCKLFQGQICKMHSKLKEMRNAADLTPVTPKRGAGGLQPEVRDQKHDPRDRRPCKLRSKIKSGKVCLTCPLDPDERLETDFIKKIEDKTIKKMNRIMIEKEKKKKLKREKEFKKRFGKQPLEEPKAPCLYYGGSGTCTSCEDALHEDQKKKMKKKKKKKTARPPCSWNKKTKDSIECTACVPAEYTEEMKQSKVTKSKNKNEITTKTKISKKKKLDSKNVLLVTNDTRRKSAHAGKNNQTKSRKNNKEQSKSSDITNTNNLNVTYVENVQSYIATETGKNDEIKTSKGNIGDDKITTAGEITKQAAPKIKHGSVMNETTEHKDGPVSSDPGSYCTITPDVKLSPEAINMGFSIPTPIQGHYSLTRAPIQQDYKQIDNNSVIIADSKGEESEPCGNIITRTVQPKVCCDGKSKIFAPPKLCCSKKSESQILVSSKNKSNSRAEAATSGECSRFGCNASDTSLVQLGCNASDTRTSLVQLGCSKYYYNQINSPNDNAHMNLDNTRTTSASNIATTAAAAVSRPEVGTDMSEFTNTRNSGTRFGETSYDVLYFRDRKENYCNFENYLRHAKNFEIQHSECGVVYECEDETTAEAEAEGEPSTLLRSAAGRHTLRTVAPAPSHPQDYT